MKPIASFPGLFIFMFVALQNTCRKAAINGVDLRTLITWRGCELDVGRRCLATNMGVINLRVTFLPLRAEYLWSCEHLGNGVLGDEGCLNATPPPLCPPHVHLTSTLLLICALIPVDSHQLHNIVPRPPSLFVLWVAFSIMQESGRAAKAGKANTHHVNGLEIKSHSS